MYIFLRPIDMIRENCTYNLNSSPFPFPKLYKARWQVELFFKWIKQHLRVKAFYGNTPNAVKTQIWIAICAYLLVAILKKGLQVEKSMYIILEILSVTLFEEVDVRELLMENDSRSNIVNGPEQVDLFSF